MQTITLKGYGTNIPSYEAIELGTYDSYGVEQLQIVPSHGWENLSIIASFFPPSGAEPIKVAVLSGGIIDVPPGATAKQSGKGIIVFAGYKANTQLISTNVAYNIRGHKDIASGDPVCPTPSVVDQIMNAAKAAQEGAEKAAQDASEAKTSANKSQKNAEKSQQAAEKAAVDAAKAGPYAESALAAAKAAKASENSVKVSENAAATSENNARISADKAKASETAAKESAVAAAGSASQAETQKTAAAKYASDAQGYMQTASGAANAANASAEHAAGSKAAAENSASAAAGSEQAAGTSELKAAKSEKAAKASEKAASESAQAALESKTAAATSEVNAATSAKKAQDVSDSLPEDYTTAVNDIATLKQQVANITPDDSSIGYKPWSSKNIIDMLCPPIEESGNPVQCYPVENYPLGVKVSWEPTQEGSGTPSPDNIRPIKGMDSVKVERCGENLFDIAQCIDVNRPRGYGLAVTVDDTGLIRVFGVPTVNNDNTSVRFRILYTNQVILTKEYNVKWFVVKGVVSYITRIQNDKSIVLSTTLSPNTPVDIQFRLMYYTGTTSPTTYEPYTGSTTDIALPETVYGGEVDAVTGDGQETWRMRVLDGTEPWGAYKIPDGRIRWYWNVGMRLVENLCLSNVYKSVTSFDTYKGIEGISTQNVQIVLLDSRHAADETSEWKAYLAAQYAAGTPVQIAYKLAEPVPFTATGAQPIPALAGVNTVLTDADSATVTGRADPIKRITDLEDAVASQT